MATNPYVSCRSQFCNIATLCHFFGIKTRKRRNLAGWIRTLTFSPWKMYIWEYDSSRKEFFPPWRYRRVVSNYNPQSFPNASKNNYGEKLLRFKNFILLLAKFRNSVKISIDQFDTYYSVTSVILKIIMTRVIFYIVDNWERQGISSFDSINILPSSIDFFTLQR